MDGVYIEPSNSFGIPHRQAEFSKPLTDILESPDEYYAIEITWHAVMAPRDSNYPWISVRSDGRVLCDYTIDMGRLDEDGTLYYRAVVNGPFNGRDIAIGTIRDDGIFVPRYREEPREHEALADALEYVRRHAGIAEANRVAAEERNPFGRFLRAVDDMLLY
ncbi:MAG: hypothetical protein QF824_03485 [Candidatus Woesearchaeota archaeon]|jgi:hypothetical protein|nr:hypothetical protein [Candidatus Woesearchaeota archaeon]MDP7457451.1 hypothetical protein [Candidatus Woesearchaeota archaeon]